MRKIFYYLVPCLLWIGMVSCGEEDVSSPAAPTFTVDKTSGLNGATEFTFTVDQVSANSISLLPYGTENPSMGGVLIPASSFANGKATVKFTYGKIGTYNAVAVANNHSTDGTSIKNVYSAPTVITISNDQKSITDFAMAGSTKTTIDQTAKTIAVIVAYGSNITTAKATFTASADSKVTVGSTDQKSGETANNFTSPVTYKVTAANGTTSDYVVTVTVTDIEKVTSIKSFAGTAVSKAAKNKALATAVDNTAKKIVIYDTLGTPSNIFDSVRIKWELDGKFAVLKYGGKKIKQDSLLNFTSAKQVEVWSQDSANTKATYDVYAAQAPKLTLSFNALNPTVTAKPSNFGIALNVLSGTNVAAIATTSAVVPPAGVTVVGITANDLPFVSGGMVDYSKDVKFVLTVTDANIGGGVTYKVTYTVKVTVLK